MCQALTKIESNEAAALAPFVGQRVRCVVKDSNPIGQEIFSEELSSSTKLILVRKLQRTYHTGDVADFWVIATSSDGSFCLLSDNGFGMSPISDRMRPRYVKALRKSIDVLSSVDLPDPEDSCYVSDLKGMYTRCVRKDQWDWFTVWSLLGQPPLPVCKILSNVLGELGKAIRSSDALVVQEVRENLRSEILTEWNCVLDVLESGSVRIPNKTRRAATRSIATTTQVINSAYDSSKLELANRIHFETLQFLTQNLVEQGFHPHEHDLIDLFCQLKTGPAIFEVKSLSTSNEESQIRSAFSQLSYYCFVAAGMGREFQGASRWLVLSSAPRRDDLLSWMESESVHVIWLDGDHFSGSLMPWNASSRVKP